MPGNGSTQVKCEPPSSDDEDNRPQLADIFLNEKLSMQYGKENITENEHDLTTNLLHLQSGSGLEELAPLAPAATPVCIKQEAVDTPALTLQTLQSAPLTVGSSPLERHMAMLNTSDSLDSVNFMSLQVVKDEPTSEGEQQQLSGDDTSDSWREWEPAARPGPKNWSQKDMDSALDALKNHHMSLTKASSVFGIPSTTLWQRARRLGIATPKREGGARAWRDCDLRAALLALRAGALSANKASKAYGIPSSTLYKIARREGIRLAAPFNAAPVSWRRADLARALHAIRAGAASVQRAAATYGIPTGTLYGRCKREGIELSRSNPTPWSEDAMGEALEAVRVGQMSINQAAIHYNLPYSSLYGRFKRCKYLAQTQSLPSHEEQKTEACSINEQDLSYYNQTANVPHEADHTAHHQYPPNEYVPTTSPYNSAMLEDPYGGQAMYYNQNYNTILTS